MKDDQQPYSFVVKHYFPQADVRNSPHHCFQNDNDNIFFFVSSGRMGSVLVSCLRNQQLAQLNLCHWCIDLSWRHAVHRWYYPHEVYREGNCKEKQCSSVVQSWIQQELELPNNFSGNSYRNSINPISSLHAVRLTIPLGLFYLSPSLTPRSCHPTPHPLSSLSDSTTATSQ